jgi:hypothetical protein
MTPEQLRDARAKLGELWGLGRPLKASELGRALRLSGRDVGESIRDWERGKTPISGPVSVAVEAMLRGFRPGWALTG